VNAVIAGVLFQCLSPRCVVCVSVTLALKCAMTNHFRIIVVLGPFAIWALSLTEKKLIVISLLGNE